MSTFRLLLVEDSDEDISTCEDTLRRYKDEKGREVELVTCRTFEEALRAIHDPFDGAIIDIKLAARGDEGVVVVSRIREGFYRIPVAILTGTPDGAGTDEAYIGVFKKGEADAGYAALLDQFWEIYDTGLTRIMGGRGVIEETLSNVFRQNILPHKAEWIPYGVQDQSRTERALLRHVLSHLLQSLDTDDDRFYPEEVYLAPPISKNITTGCVIKEKESDKWHVVLTPACDLAIRTDGTTNTDRVLIVEIDDQTAVLPAIPATGLSNSQKGEMENAFKNKKSEYYHWLPRTGYFAGGFANFRKVQSRTKLELPRDFDPPALQISTNFVKDMVARFSSYYARQGQPEIDHAQFIPPRYPTAAAK